jgi:hypothetical protein
MHENIVHDEQTHVRIVRQEIHHQHEQYTTQIRVAVHHVDQENILHNDEHVRILTVDILEVAKQQRRHQESSVQNPHQVQHEHTVNHEYQVVQLLLMDIIQHKHEHVSRRNVQHDLIVHDER